MLRLVTLIGCFFLTARWMSADVALTTDRPVYKTGAAGTVKITVKNSGAAAVSVPGPVKIVSGASVVAEVALGLDSDGTLGSNEAVTISWNKKNAGGQPVEKGTYTVQVGDPPVSRMIALTPTGKIAGDSYAPLTVGNQWVSKAIGTPSGNSLDVGTVYDVNGSWYKITLAGNNVWASMTGTVQLPTLQVKDPIFGIVKDLFLFKRPLNYVYTVDLAPFAADLTLKVGSINDTVPAPAGTFKGCYRLDNLGMEGGSFTFAAGIGLVKYSKVSPPSQAVLYRAKLKGSDGAWYTIGLP